MQNPLTEHHVLPPFSRIQHDNVVPAVNALIQASEETLNKILETKSASADPLTWSDLVEPLEEAEDNLSQAWSPVSHLNSVCNSDELREAYEEAQQALTAYYSELGQNEALYHAYEQLSKSEAFSQFSQAQRQTIEHALRGFRLSGVALEGEKKEAFKQIKSELSSLTTKFSNNVLDASNAWHYHLTDEQGLAGLPNFLIEAAKAAAEEKSLEGWVFTLDIPVYMTVMSQSENRDLRKAMYEAYATRASDLGPNAGEWDNTPLIEKILELRQKQAELLGYKNFAEVSLASKMAESPEHVMNFLQDLADKTRPFAEKEVEELRVFAKETAGVETLEAWDVPYYSEQLKLKKHNVSQEILRQYFPLPVVQEGLFRVVKKLYNIDVVKAEAETWHKDAEYYELQRDGKAFASFYFDLFARPKKRGGAWMADCRTRRRRDGALQLPVAFLVCNFNAPVGDKPALLSHDEVTTLFHEFGHGLHHMLTKMDVASVSGINGVEWDAVELPSQFMENFCWDPDALAFLSQHHETGESLPEDLLENMLDAKNFQSAMQMLRQLEFALFDLRLHMEFGSETFTSVQDLLDDVRKHVAVLIPPKFNKFQNGFTHIFAGGYAAGYYSYKWAEVLSADAFSAFEEEGVFNPETGQRFLTEILEKGGSESALELFKRFRGREPSAEALMRHSGLVA